jgi:hypothetical protein
MIVARSVLEAALAEDEKAQLWFELGGEDEETRRLAIDVSAADLEEILSLSGDDDVALTLHGEDVAGLFDDADVEAHGMRGAIAIAVTSAALLAPAANAATTQSIGTAATTQQAGVAATAEIGMEATAQVANAAATAQVARTQARLAKSQAANLKAYKILRFGLAR